MSLLPVNLESRMTQPEPKIDWTFQSLISYKGI